MVEPDSNKNAAPSSLGDILSGLVSQFGIGRKREENELEDAWKEAVGELAEYTSVGSIRRGVLEIRVTDAIFAQELLFRKTELLRALQERFPDEKLTDLRFKTGN